MFSILADVMRNMGVATILAVDIGAEDTEELTDYGDSLSGWWLLWKKYFPFTKPVNVIFEKLLLRKTNKKFYTQLLVGRLNISFI